MRRKPPPKHPTPEFGGLVEALWQRLGLDDWFAGVRTDRGADALGDAVFAMVANRLVDPCSKRRLVEWAKQDVVMPNGWSPPSLDQYYRAAATDVCSQTAGRA